MEILNACLDDTEKKTIRRSDLLFGSDVIPDKLSLFDRTQVFDQHKAGDDMGCIIYGLTHTKHDTEDKVSLQPHNERVDACTNSDASPTKGRGMQSGIRFYKGKNYLSGYALAVGVDEIKMVLCRMSGIFTGSNKIDRTSTKARKDKMVVIKNDSPGHAFEICGFDDNRQDSDGKYKGALECKNSNGSFSRFWVPYDLVKKLYSTIEVIFDEKVKQEMKKRNDEETLTYAIQEGITNGDNLNGVTTRGQAVVMVYRLKHPNALYEQALVDAKDEGIWDGTREFDSVLRSEVMIMCGRVLDNSFGKPDEHYISLAIKKMVTNGMDRDKTIIRLDTILMVTRTRKLLP